MCYVCGKSRNRIIHTQACRYVKMMPDKNKKSFNSIKEALDAGYVRCKYCAHINKYVRKEKKELDLYCGSKGVYYYFNRTDGALDVISRTGKWKIIVNGQRHFIWLYHKNNNGESSGDLVPGFHSQKIRSSSLMGYMEYIVRHDEYRIRNPLYESQIHLNVMKGSKKWKKDRRREKNIRRIQSIRYVTELLNNMANGNIAY